MNRTSRRTPSPRHVLSPAVRRTIRHALLWAGVALVMTVLTRESGSAPFVPADFVVEDITPGANFVVPTCIAPLPDGRILVGEKRGRVWAVKNGVRHPTPLWQSDAEVLDSYDRGLMGMAVDPNYLVNHLVYFLYTVDPDSDDVEDEIEAWGRLTRYQVSFADSNVVAPASRTILFGSQWSNGPLIASGSHTVGCARFGTDGSLLISIGDGSDFTVGPDMGGLQPNAFLPGRTDPVEDIGSYRSQFIKSLCGKVLRINPVNGHGYPSNPFYDGDSASVRSRVWAYGFRNPFRFTVRPGSGSTDPADGDPGSIYLGDVGWNDWEEWNVIAGPGFNSGWPCYEGPAQQAEYWPLSPDHSGCDSIGITPNNPSPASAPIASWHHRLDYAGNPPGFLGNASVGGIFYSDTLYPAAYRGHYFHGDYGQSWIRDATMTPLDTWTSFTGFGAEMDGPVDFAREPGTGNILYSSIFTGEIRRIRYTGSVGGNTAPVAIATGIPTDGPAPLEVQFTGSSSSDADSDSLTHTWLFGDGGGAPIANPLHSYAEAGAYLAILIVSDGRGGEGRDTVPVLASPLTTFPSTPVLDDFNRPNAPLTTPWVSDVEGLAVQDGALVQTSGYGFPIWDGTVFGPDQEAYITIKTLAGSPASERDLVLKAQGITNNAAHIEIRYDATVNQVAVGTYDPGTGWLAHGAPIPASYAAGDRLGCRAYGNGTVEVYQNSTKVGTRAIVGWPYVASGGRVGLTLDAVNRGSLDDFGGGDVVFAVNNPPVAGIVSPADSSFYAAPDTVYLVGFGSDQDEPADSLDYRWDIFLHHNTHLHLAISLAGPEVEFETVDHDDGSGVWYEARLIVTDSEGLEDTTSIVLFQEADLDPSAIEVIPNPPLAGEPVEYRFHLVNRGSMTASVSRWVLTLDGVTLAQGDTVVTALDSLRISVEGAAPAAGPHLLRVRADSLGTLVETDESNNAELLALTVESPVVNTPPVAAIAAPRNGAFYAPFDPVLLASGATDAEDAPAGLILEWGVILRRSGPDSLIANPVGDSATFVTMNHEDGNGVRYEVRLRVTDSVGLVDSASVTIWPECDLTPGPINTNAVNVAAGTPVEAAFWLRNLGRHAVRRSQWHMLLDGVPLAAGDTVVARLDSVQIHVLIPGGLTAGAHALRAVADTLGQVVETNELNNASMLEMTVLATATGVTAGPVRARALSPAWPNPTRGAMSMTLDLPEAGEVGFEVLDLQGRVVRAQPSRILTAGRWTLAWDGRLDGGAAAPPGLYLVRVRAANAVFVRRIARMH
ncbi:MAG: PQQ-dependent sugar dehydrogenase [Candidatus Eisenbacteria bacterium]